MTNDDVLFLAQTLPLVDAPDMDPDFNYLVSAAMRLAEGVEKDIKKALEPKKVFQDYLDAMEELRKTHAKKDKEGKPIQKIEAGPNGPVKQYDIPDVNNLSSPFQKAVEKLNEDSKVALDARKKQLEFLDKENKNYNPDFISRDLHPKGLSRRAMDAIFLITKK